MMKKRLALELDNLSVESFSTSPEREATLGTVHAHSPIPTGQVTCPELTCGDGCSGEPVATCDSSCMTAPCAYTSPMPGCESGYVPQCYPPLEP